MSNEFCEVAERELELGKEVIARIKVFLLESSIAQINARARIGRR
jgi:DNA-binding ferritin-like protein